MVYATDEAKFYFWKETFEFGKYLKLEDWILIENKIANISSNTKSYDDPLPNIAEIMTKHFLRFFYFRSTKKYTGTYEPISYLAIDVRNNWINKRAKKDDTAYNILYELKQGTYNKIKTKNFF